MRVRFVLVFLAFCSASFAHAASPAPAKASSAAKPGATSTKTSAARIPTRPPVVPFVEDDFTKAVAEARARKVPLFVEAWAPW